MSALPNFPPALYSPEALYATKDDEAFALKVEERFTALWADLTVLSDELADLKELDYCRPYRSTYDGRVTAGRYSGTDALTALRDGDTAEFGRLVHKAMVDAVQQLASDQIDDETPDPEFDL
jgi:hypothetical protein